MKKSYIVAAVVILLTIPSIVTSHNVLFIIQDLALVWTLFVIKQVKKDGALSGGEKAQVILTELFNPLIVGLFYYFSLNNQFPKKAKQAGKYALIILLVWIVLIALIF